MLSLLTMNALEKKYKAIDIVCDVGYNAVKWSYGHLIELWVVILLL